MAHEIENEMFAYVGEPAWHNIGTECPEGSSAADLFTAAKLDWEVTKYPLVAKVGDTEVEIPNKSAIIRSTDNKLMTISSEGWEPVQNADVAAFMQSFCDAGKATMECAGALKGGNMIWGLANLGHSFEVRPGDVTKGYLALTSSHVVGTATKSRVTTTRIVCRNTMALAEKDSQPIYKQNHMSVFDFEAAKKAVGEAHESLSLQEKKLRQLDLLKLSISDATLKALIPVFADEMMELEMPEKLEILTSPGKMPKVLANIINSIVDAPGAIPNTAYGILQGVTHWASHIVGNNQQTRIYNQLSGGLSNKILELESRLLELAQ